MGEPLEILQAVVGEVLSTSPQVERGELGQFLKCLQSLIGETLAPTEIQALELWGVCQSGQLLVGDFAGEGDGFDVGKSLESSCQVVA